jgi:hypothetical protein
MQSRTHTSLALLSTLTTLAALAVLPASWAIQTCTQKFSGLTTCTLFNDQFATGDAVSLEATKVIDEQLMAGYANTTSIHKNIQCNILYNLYGCINAINHPQFPAAAPCSSTGARLKMCKGLCVQYERKCSKLGRTHEDIDKMCTQRSAPAGDECFGDAGVLGMESAAHTSLPPMFAVLFLALAVSLSTSAPLFVLDNKMKII